jgi:hypothetical protein
MAPHEQRRRPKLHQGRKGYLYLAIRRRPQDLHLFFARESDGSVAAMLHEAESKQ